MFPSCAYVHQQFSQIEHTDEQSTRNKGLDANKESAGRISGKLKGRSRTSFSPKIKNRRSRTFQNSGLVELGFN